MKIQISNQSKDPIYIQIYQQIRDQIADNSLVKDTKLPSIRSFALDLSVSVITVKRAYEDLERDGYIYSIPGKGSYVRDLNSNILKEKYLEEILTHLEEVAKLADIVGINEKQIMDYYKKEMKKL